MHCVQLSLGDVHQVLCSEGLFLSPCLYLRWNSQGDGPITHYCLETWRGAAVCVHPVLRGKFVDFPRLPSYLYSLLRKLSVYGEVI